MTPRTAFRFPAILGLFTALAAFFCAQARAQYTPSGTAQAFTGYNTDFLRTDSSSNLFFANAQSGTSAAGFWEQANEIAMAVDGYNWALKNDTADLPAYIAEINSLCAGFTDAHGHSWSSDAFNDDLNWATMAFARAYQATGTASQLADAETNFNTVWSRGQSPAGAGNGLAGLIQIQPPNTPNLDSPVNFTFVIAGYILYNITGTSTYKTEADSVYTWSMANLYQPAVDGGICNNHPTLTCSKIYDANNLSVGGSTGEADYTYNYGTAIEAITLEGNATVAQNVANWLMYNSNNTNDPYVGTYTLNGTAYNVLPNYQQGGVNGAGYNGIGMRGISFGLAQGALNASTLAWAQANASAIYSIRNSIGVSWNNWLTQTPLTGLYSWDDSASMATLFLIPSSSVAVTAPAAANVSQIVTLTATVTPAVTATPATGTVQFYVNGKATGSPAPVSANIASLQTSFTTPGTTTIKASYSGDANYTASVSQPTTVAIGTPTFTAAPTTSAFNLISGAASGNTGSIVVATTNGFAGNVALACTVLNTSGNAAGSCALSPTAVTLSTALTSVASTLTLTTTPGTSGSLSVVVTATGSGETVTTPSIVANLTASSFTVTPSPSSVTFPAGGSTTSTLTLNSVNGFSGNVALTCSTSGAATGTCSLSPSTVSLASAGSTTSTLTLNAPAGTSGALAIAISATGKTTGASLAATASTSVSATVVTPSFTLAVAPTALSFTSGASTGNSVAATITSVNYFASPVTFTCSLSSSTAAFQPTCIGTPAIVTPSANASASSTFVVYSTTAQASNHASLGHAPLWPILPTTVLALVFITPLRRRRLPALAALLLIASATLALNGCSGASNAASTPLRSSAGTYTLTITATSGASTQTATVPVTIN